MRKRILVIYNGHIILELLTSILSEEGYAVDGSDGGEGLKMAYDREYDIIISDIDMPITNGIEFCMRLIEKRPSIKQKILFITSDKNIEANTLFKKTRVKYLLKPFKTTDLLKAVGEIAASAPIVDNISLSG